MIKKKIQIKNYQSFGSHNSPEFGPPQNIEDFIQSSLQTNLSGGIESIYAMIENQNRLLAFVTSSLVDKGIIDDAHGLASLGGWCADATFTE